MYKGFAHWAIFFTYLQDTCSISFIKEIVLFEFCLLSVCLSICPSTYLSLLVNWKQNLTCLDHRYASLCFVVEPLSESSGPDFCSCSPGQRVPLCQQCILIIAAAQLPRHWVKEFCLSVFTAFCIWLLESTSCSCRNSHQPIWQGLCCKVSFFSFKCTFELLWVYVVL